MNLKKGNILLQKKGRQFPYEFVSWPTKYTAVYVTFEGQN